MSGLIQQGRVLFSVCLGRIQKEHIVDIYIWAMIIFYQPITIFCLDLLLVAENPSHVQLAIVQPRMYVYQTIGTYRVNLLFQTLYQFLTIRNDVERI